VREGGVHAFDGDLDDYRDLLLGRKSEPAAAPRPRSQPPKAPRGRPNLKNLQNRIKRLEELMTRLNERIAQIEARLAEPAAYQDPEGLKALLADQAYLRKELGEVENEWLAKQGELES
jgi:ATP-binding cassette subfamily F protein 3